jgi:putative addiction module component (TIGR02574 family)
MKAIESVRRKALSLSKTDRARLARDLIESLDEGPKDRGAARAWAEELESRVESLRSGRAKTVSGKDAIAWARARLKRRGR